MHGLKLLRISLRVDQRHAMTTMGCCVSVNVCLYLLARCTARAGSAQCVCILSPAAATDPSRCVRTVETVAAGRPPLMRHHSRSR